MTATGPMTAENEINYLVPFTVITGILCTALVVGLMFINMLAALLTGGALLFTTILTLGCAVTAWGIEHRKA